jgi:nucleotide-binding universal stress UspA family protein
MLIKAMAPEAASLDHSRRRRPMGFDFFLPLLTYPDRSPVDAVRRAVDLAATLGGRLTIAAHVVDIPPITNPLSGGLIDFAAMSEAAEAASKERAEELANETAHMAQRVGLPVQVQRVSCNSAGLQDRLGQCARTHDLSLLAIDSTSAGHRDAAEGLLFDGGGPVALLPSSAATHIETVAIAWDGGRSAARAVRDALPILQLAKQVVVLTVGDDKHVPTVSVAGLSAFLSGHSIKCEHRDTTREGYSIGEALQSHALANDSGLLVMGAYGHSRIREFVLGGATRTVLKDVRLPVLMSH